MAYSERSEAMERFRAAAVLPEWTMKTVSQMYPRLLSRGMDSAMPMDDGLPATMWKIHRALITARERFGIGPQPLATLRALISFLRNGGDLVVFASNRTLAARAEGLDERTIRRHISAMVAAGLIRRQSSSNGKRFRNEKPGGEGESYGIDLSPLLARRLEIAEAAAETENEMSLVRYQRRRLSSLIYAASECLVDPRLILSMRPALRRKLTSTEFAALGDQLEEAIALKSTSDYPALPSQERLDAAADMSGKDGQNVRHKISSNNKEIDSDCATRPAEADVATEQLRNVLRNCPDALAYAEAVPRNWWELEVTAWTLAAWCGIGRDALTTAERAIGRRSVAITIMALVQRMKGIRNIPAYFTSLTIGKRSVGFDPVRMISRVSTSSQ